MLEGNNNEQNNENTKKTQAATELDAKKEGAGLFITEADRTWMLQLGDEAVTKQIKESFLYYRIDYKKTKTHRLYGQAKKKHYLPEIEIYGRIDVESNPPEYMAPGGFIRQGMGKITAHVYLHELEEKNVTLSSFQAVGRKND